MDKSTIREFIELKTKERSRLLGIAEPTLKPDTDLIREGYFDSLSFVDLIGECEQEFNIEIQLEKYDPKDFSIVHHLTEIILHSK